MSHFAEKQKSFAEILELSKVSAALNENEFGQDPEVKTCE
jgi:hypothetical protein